MDLDQKEIDEVLEAIWVAREQNRRSIPEIKEICIHQYHGMEIDVDEVLSHMQRMKLVSVVEGKVDYLSEGEERARAIIRRHRLAERLFTDVLTVSETSMEMTACRFEHILNSEVTDSVCALLGHPPLCPHGKPIPSGECCKSYRKNHLKPLVFPLSDIELGKEGKIVFITPSFHNRFDRLASLGVITGNCIRVHQKEPSFVVRLGETELAIDEAIAREIFVKYVDHK